MALDAFGLRGQVGQFLDAYNDEFAKHLKQIGAYPGKSEIVERLLKEKDVILQRFVEYQDPSHYRLPFDKDRETYMHFIEQLDAFIKRKVKRHLDEIAGLILETQTKIGGLNRMSWEADKSKVALLHRIADEFISGVKIYFKTHFVQDLDLGVEKKAGPFTPNPIETVKSGIQTLLQNENPSEGEATPYDVAIREMESWLIKDKEIKGRNFSTLARHLGNDVVQSITTWLEAKDANQSYKSILKEGYVSLEEFRRLASIFINLVEKLKLALEKYGTGELKPVFDDTVKQGAGVVRKKIVYSLLFRNTLMHAGLVVNIRQDLPYDVAYYLYFKPAFEHYKELKLIFEKAILQRLLNKDKYATDLKLIGHLLNDIKSQLDTFNDSLKRYY